MRTLRACSSLGSPMLVTAASSDASPRYLRMARLNTVVVAPVRRTAPCQPSTELTRACRPRSSGAMERTAMECWAFLKGTHYSPP